MFKNLGFMVLSLGRGKIEPFKISRLGVWL